MSPQVKRSLAACAAIVLLALQGCATVKSADARDPWESMNRRVYQFNDALDAAVVRPVAQGYEKVVPGFMRKGVHNFLGNLGDVKARVALLALGDLDSLDGDEAEDETWVNEHGWDFTPGQPPSRRW